MQALIVDSNGVQLRETPRPAAEPGEVLIRVLTAGICGTDLEIVRGYGQFTGILGHEFVGIVEEGPPRLAGRRVVGEINCVCGRCEMCGRGLSNHCLRRTVAGIVNRPGVFAEYVALPERNCHLVPDAVSNDDAVFTEPLAAAYQVTRQVKLDPRLNVAVVGTGRLGLLVAAVLTGAGCRPVAIGRNPKTLDLLDRWRIRASRIEEIRSAQSFDVVVDCTGAADGIEIAGRLVRPRGTIVLKTTCRPERAMDLSPLVVHEVTVLGSRCGPFGDALAALARRQLDTAAMITQRLPLSRGVEALRLAAQPDQIKVLLQVSS